MTYKKRDGRGREDGEVNLAARGRIERPPYIHRQAQQPGEAMDETGRAAMVSRQTEQEEKLHIKIDLIDVERIRHIFSKE